MAEKKGKTAKLIELERGAREKRKHRQRGI